MSVTRRPRRVPAVPDTPADRGPVRCAWCFDVVGVYEPATFQLDSGEVIHASIARGLGEGDEPVGMVFHRRCFEETQ